MLFNPNANDPVNTGDMSFIARDVRGLIAHARWEARPSCDTSSFSPNSLPIYQINPMNGSRQEIHFMQSNQGYVPNVGWSHELLIRVLIHNLESQPPSRDPDIARCQHKTTECLRDALTHLLAADALMVSNEEQQASWGNVK